MNELMTIKNFIGTIKTPNATIRVVRDIGDGRLAILQVVNPENDPVYARWLRARAEKNKAIRILHAFETANRVAGCVFKNIMRKEGK